MMFTKSHRYERAVDAIIIGALVGHIWGASWTTVLVLVALVSLSTGAAAIGYYRNKS